jgi:hypothetical protein
VSAGDWVMAGIAAYLFVGFVAAKIEVKVQRSGKKEPDWGEVAATGVFWPVIALVGAAWAVCVGLRYVLDPEARRIVHRDQEIEEYRQKIKELDEAEKLCRDDEFMRTACPELRESYRQKIAELQKLQPRTAAKQEPLQSGVSRREREYQKLLAEVRERRESWTTDAPAYWE